jgi:hypothetical protein
VRRPSRSNAPALSSITGIVTPANQRDQRGELQKILSGVLDRAQSENFPDAGHEEDQAENEPGKKQCPGAMKIFSHLMKPAPIGARFLV